MQMNALNRLFLREWCVPQSIHRFARSPVLSLIASVSQRRHCYLSRQSLSRTFAPVSRPSKFRLDTEGVIEVACQRTNVPSYERQFDSTPSGIIAFLSAFILAFVNVLNSYIHKAWATVLITLVVGTPFAADNYVRVDPR